MKTFIRTLRPTSACPLWHNETERARVKQDLNDFGFYVLTGVGDSLDVYAICDEKPLELVLLEKIMRWWHERQQNKMV
jgi:hypothetical protein